jgi:hypothetical protein
VPDDDSFASLAERHLGPILTRAGFAAGQWGSGSRISQELSATGWTTVVHPWSESGTYCTGAADYVRRYPDLAAGREDSYYGGHPQACLDIVLEGTVDGGVTSITVEFEDLADLLRSLDRTEDAAAVEQALASREAETGLTLIATVLRRLYLPDHAAPEPGGASGPG